MDNLKTKLDQIKHNIKELSKTYPEIWKWNYNRIVLKYWQVFDGLPLLNIIPEYLTNEGSIGVAFRKAARETGIPPRREIHKDYVNSGYNRMMLDD